MKRHLRSRTTAVVGSLLLLAACSETPTGEHGAEDPTSAEHSAGEHGDGDKPHWSYTGADDGPDDWGSLGDGQYELCASGRQQSPIDLTPAAEVAAQAIEFAYHSAKATIENNGHTVEVKPAAGNSISFADGEVAYDVKQFHFHAPGEHVVGATSYPAELHIVHTSSTGERAVVGLLLEEGAANPALEPVLANLPATESPATDLGSEVDMANFLPADRTSYRYPGSLTTPPCDQGVNWIVLKEPVEISADQLDRLEAAVHHNNRPVQPANDRMPIEAGTP